MNLSQKQSIRITKSCSTPVERSTNTYPRFEDRYDLCEENYQNYNQTNSNLPNLQADTKVRNLKYRLGRNEVVASCDVVEFI